MIRTLLALGAHCFLSLFSPQRNRFGYRFGAKLVRGAYLVSERERAKEMGYPDPTWPNIEATHAAYDRCTSLLLDRIAAGPGGGAAGGPCGRRRPTEFMCASHNQASVEHVVRRMGELGVAPGGSEGGAVYFGQLLGMSDNLTFLLGGEGYLAYKYVPYGPVEEVVPYLLRRAQENSQALAMANAEVTMLGSELRRRIIPFAS